MNVIDFDAVMPYTKMFYGMRPYPDEIKEGRKRCGLTRKQWEKKKREKRTERKREIGNDVI